MKLTEVLHPSATAIFESLKEDTENTFSDSELQAISESVAKFDQNAEAMSVNEFVNFLNSFRKDSV